MTDHPVIFSGPMVRALLDGRKTQTRRMLYAKRKAKGGVIPASASILTYTEKVGERHVRRAYQPVSSVYSASPDDYFVLTGWHKRKPGDRLWARENALYWVRNSDNRKDKVAAYAADGYELEPGERWTPSIHMPRWASRLTLTITATKIERVQAISEADAMAEGCRPLAGGRGSAADDFRSLWESINGPNAWAGNPWVVALAFDVAKQNIDHKEAA